MKNNKILGANTKDITQLFTDQTDGNQLAFPLSAEKKFTYYKCLWPHFTVLKTFSGFPKNPVDMNFLKTLKVMGHKLSAIDNIKMRFIQEGRLYEIKHNKKIY